MRTEKKKTKKKKNNMYEPCILKKELQYSCDMCGELPITGKRWCCDVCEDFGELLVLYTVQYITPDRTRQPSPRENKK